MKTILIPLLATAVAAISPEPTTSLRSVIPNRLIDYPGFQKIVVTSAAEREKRRLTEEEFLAEMAKPNVVVLDARTDRRFTQRHIRGAVNLPFTEFTEATLAATIPSKDTKVLIYCNNNFLGSPVAFASKMAPASLNLSTYTSLKAYGYTNVWELGPLLDVRTSRIPFVGSEMR